MISQPALVRVSGINRRCLDRMRQRGMVHPTRVGNALFYSSKDAQVVVEYMKGRKYSTTKQNSEKEASF